MKHKRYGVLRRLGVGTPSRGSQHPDQRGKRASGGEARTAPAATLNASPHDGRKQDDGHQLVVLPDALLVLFRTPQVGRCSWPGATRQGLRDLPLSWGAGTLASAPHVPASEGAARGRPLCLKCSPLVILVHVYHTLDSFQLSISDTWIS